MASSGSRKNTTDCRYFMADSLSCRKGLDCDFRHSVVAQSQPNICRGWKAQSSNRTCRFQHPGKSGAVQKSPCPTCNASVCECGYGNPSKLSFQEQQPQVEEQHVMENQIRVTGATFTRVSSLNVGGRGVINVSISQDGTILAIFGKKRASASLRSTEGLEEVYPYPNSLAFRDLSGITNVCFGDGFVVVALAKDGKVWIWGLKSPPQPPLRQQTTIHSMDATGNKVCWVDDSRVYYWKLGRNGMKSVGTVYLEGLNHMGNSTAKIKFLGRAGNTLIAVSVGNKVYVLHVKTQLIEGTLEGHKNPVLSLCWDETRSLLTSVSKEMINVWDLSDATIPETFFARLKSTTDNPFTCAVFHPFIDHCIVIGLEKDMAIWKVGSTSMTSIEDGKVQSLAAAGNMLASCHEDVVKIWKM